MFWRAKRGGCARAQVAHRTAGWRTPESRGEHILFSGAWLNGPSPHLSGVALKNVLFGFAKFAAYLQNGSPDNKIHMLRCSVLGDVDDHNNITGKEWKKMRKILQAAIFLALFILLVTGTALGAGTEGETVVVTFGSKDHSTTFGEPFEMNAGMLVLSNGTSLSAWAASEDVENRSIFGKAVVQSVTYDGNPGYPALSGTYSMAIGAVNAGGYSCSASTVGTLTIGRGTITVSVSATGGVYTSAGTRPSVSFAPDKQHPHFVDPNHYSWRVYSDADCTKPVDGVLGAGTWYVKAELKKEDMHNMISWKNQIDSFEITKAKSNNHLEIVSPFVNTTKRYTLNMSFLPADSGKFSYRLLAGTDAFKDFSINSDARTYSFTVAPEGLMIFEGQINFSMENYEDITLTIRVQPVDRQRVEITGVKVPSQNYNGRAVQPEGTPTNASGYEGSYEYWYSGTGATQYPETNNPPENCGTYKLIVRTFEDDPSYIGASAPIEFAITKAALTVLPEENQAKFAGENDPVLLYTSTGAIEGEIPSFSGALGRENGEAPGAYKITAGTLALVDNGSFRADNYYIELRDSTNFRIIVPTATVSPASEWVSASARILPPANYQISMDRTNWLSELPIPADANGETLVPYYLKGPTGATTDQMSITVKVDNVAPVIRFSGATNDRWTQTRTATVRVEVSDDNLVSVTCTVNGEAIEVSDPASFSIRRSGGRHTIIVTAVDVVGNTTEQTFTLKCGITTTSTPEPTPEPTVVPVEALITLRAGDNGTILGGGLTYTFQPNEGYVVENAWVDGVSIGARSGYTFADDGTAHVLAVTFARADDPFAAEAAEIFSVQPPAAKLDGFRANLSAIPTLDSNLELGEGGLVKPENLPDEVYVRAVENVIISLDNLVGTYLALSEEDKAQVTDPEVAQFEQKYTDAWRSIEPDALRLLNANTGISLRVPVESDSVTQAPALRVEPYSEQIVRDGGLPVNGTMLNAYALALEDGAGESVSLTARDDEETEIVLHLPSAANTEVSIFVRDANGDRTFAPVLVNSQGAATVTASVPCVIIVSIP